MRKFFNVMVVLTFCLTSILAKSQTLGTEGKSGDNLALNRFVSGGTGVSLPQVFTQDGAAEIGSTIWFEGGVKLRHGVSLSGLFSYGRSFSHFDSEAFGGLIEGQRKDRLRIGAGLFAGKNFGLSKKHIIVPRLGLMFLREYHNNPWFEVWAEGETIHLEANTSYDRFNKLCVALTLDYSYQLSTSCAVGLRFGVHKPWALPVGGFNVTPFVGLLF
ncbi:MAG: hypothetical protein RBT74_17155 [Tenuifilaceae bacterium]|jgi:hypothetical protein|nr:hypothetical protein [Tenuifilaceae bacterium]